MKLLLLHSISQKLFILFTLTKLCLISLYNYIMLNRIGSCLITLGYTDEEFDLGKSRAFQSRSLKTNVYLVEQSYMKSQKQRSLVQKNCDLKQYVCVCLLVQLFFKLIDEIHPLGWNNKSTFLDHRMADSRTYTQKLTVMLKCLTCSVSPFPYYFDNIPFCWYCFSDRTQI